MLGEVSLHVGGNERKIRPSVEKPLGGGAEGWVYRVHPTDNPHVAFAYKRFNTAMSLSTAQALVSMHDKCRAAGLPVIPEFRLIVNGKDITHVSETERRTPPEKPRVDGFIMTDLTKNGEQVAFSSNDFLFPITGNPGKNVSIHWTTEFQSVFNAITLSPDNPYLKDIIATCKKAAKAGIVLTHPDGWMFTLDKKGNFSFYFAVDSSALAYGEYRQGVWERQLAGPSVQPVTSTWDQEALFHTNVKYGITALFNLYQFQPRQSSTLPDIMEYRQKVLEMHNIQDTKGIFNRVW